MRKKFLFIAFSLFAYILYAQKETNQPGTWDYPIKPGTEEWGAALDRNEIL